MSKNLRKEEKIKEAVRYWRFLLRIAYDYDGENEFVCYCGLRFVAENFLTETMRCPNCEEVCTKGVNHFRDSEFKGDDARYNNVPE